MSTRHEVEVDTRIADLFAAYAQQLGFLDNQRRYEKNNRARMDARPDSTVRVRQHADSLRSLENQEARTAEAAAAYHDAETAEYEGWSRFFVVPGGHIHSTMHCSTCNKNGKRTRFGWVPELSGLTETEAVAEFGPALCSVCFASAPVEWQKATKVTKTEARNKGVKVD